MNFRVFNVYNCIRSFIGLFTDGFIKLSLDNVYWIYVIRGFIEYNWEVDMLEEIVVASEA